ncbi:MAG: ribosome maturation factor RimM [Vicinamibacterales bacterium]
MSNSISATRPASGEHDAWDDMLLVGIVARTHGNKGEVIVNPTTDFPEDRFGAGAALWGRAPGRPEIEPLEVRCFRMHAGRPVVGFRGSTTISEAERFASWELRVPASARRELPAHVYYHHDLVGCDVQTAAGEDVGRVRAVEGDGMAVRLVVAASRGDVLIPLAQEFCSVDVAARRIVVDAPDGLLDVNGPWRG